MIKTALLISTYNWPEALEKVLQSVHLQTVLPYEILIADDGSTEKTKNLIDSWKEKSKIDIKHFWQPDAGFRKTSIMNKAVGGTEGEYIIQIDGDILLDKNFVKDHITERKANFFINGSRALISEKNTQKILAEKYFNAGEVSKNVKNRINATRFPLFAPFFRKDHLKSSNVKGCNFSFWRNDFIDVNGYNNDISGWGHEDIELAARLNNIGIKQRRLKMKAVCYHLHHNHYDRKDEDNNLSVYTSMVETLKKTCANGYAESLKS